MLLQLCGWCVGPEREVNKAERKEGGHMWITHTDVHAHTPVHTHTHTCPMFSPAVSTVCFSQGLWQRDVERHSHSSPPCPHTHTHSQSHTCTHFSLWFRDVTSGWVWSVSKGLWLLFSSTHAYTPPPPTTHTHIQALTQTTHSPLESLRQAGDSSSMKAAVNDSAQSGLMLPQASLIQTFAYCLLAPLIALPAHTHTHTHTYKPCSLQGLMRQEILCLWWFGMLQKKTAQVVYTVCMPFYYRLLKEKYTVNSFGF